jgi:hypothetical protein
MTTKELKSLHEVEALLTANPTLFFNVAYTKKGAQKPIIPLQKAQGVDTLREAVYKIFDTVVDLEKVTITVRNGKGNNAKERAELIIQKDNDSPVNANTEVLGGIEDLKHTVERMRQPHLPTPQQQAQPDLPLSLGRLLFGSLGLGDISSPEEGITKIMELGIARSEEKLSTKYTLERLGEQLSAATRERDEWRKKYEDLEAEHEDTCDRLGEAEERLKQLSKYEDNPALGVISKLGGAVLGEAATGLIRKSPALSGLFGDLLAPAAPNDEQVQTAAAEQVVEVKEEANASAE